MNSKLTPNQRRELENLTQNGRLYVGFNSPDIMRTFAALVVKGYATEATAPNGKYFTLKATA